MPAKSCDSKAGGTVKAMVSRYGQKKAAASEKRRPYASLIK